LRQIRQRGAAQALASKERVTGLAVRRVNRAVRLTKQRFKLITRAAGTVLFALGLGLMLEALLP
jgi:hypothetical protein